MRTTLITTAAALTLLAGCTSAETPEPAESSSPSGSPSATQAATTDPDADLEAAVKAYSDAFLTGNADAAFALFSERCQERTDQLAFASIVEQSASLYGSELPFRSFDAEVSGDLARVTYTYDISAIDQNAEPWVREGDEWKQDDCP